jgi:hypothetical protein
MVVAAFPQSHSRMVPASERLYSAVIERRLQHPNDPELHAHAASAIAQIDALVALAMAVEAVEARPPAAELVGWL